MGRVWVTVCAIASVSLAAQRPQATVQDEYAVYDLLSPDTASSNARICDHRLPLPDSSGGSA